MKAVTYDIPVKWSPSVVLGDADTIPVPSKISVKSQLIKAGNFQHEGFVEAGV